MVATTALLTGPLSVDPPDTTPQADAPTSTHAIAAGAYSKLPYDPVKDFAHISLVAITPYLLVVNPQVPAKSLAELRALFTDSGFASPLIASGIVFVSLEDETGIANLVFMPDVYEQFRLLVRGSAFLVAQGRVERNGQVVNVRVRSVTPLTGAPGVASQARDFH